VDFDGLMMMMILYINETQKEEKHSHSDVFGCILIPVITKKWSALSVMKDSFTLATICSLILSLFK
jgi:hypothetical protein